MQPKQSYAGKIKILADAGMVHLNIGVQTNQESNEKFFRRKQKDDNIVELTRTAKELGEEGIDIKLFYDFIIYNPLKIKIGIRKTIELIKRWSRRLIIFLIHYSWGADPH